VNDFLQAPPLNHTHKPSHEAAYHKHIIIRNLAFFAQSAKQAAQLQPSFIIRLHPLNKFDSVCSFTAIAYVLLLQL